MLLFDTARDLSFVTHIVLIWAVAGYILYRAGSYGVTVFMYVLYLLLFVWYGVCVLFDGCPLTHVENSISLSLYGVAFYPNYTFSDSMISSFIKDGWLYFPLAVTVIYQLTTHKRCVKR